MKSVLIVAYLEKSAEFLSETLSSVSAEKIVTVQSCGEARRLLLEQTFDLCIINAPLRDETGENLSRHIVSRYLSQVILVVKDEFYDEVTAATEDYGVITVSKPVNRSILLSALKFAKAADSKLKLMEAKNNQLVQKIQDIRIVDRAKCILISYLNMSESQAHKYIEKQAMDTRTTKREVAEGILKTYEN